METQKESSLLTLKKAFEELKNSRMVLAPKHISKILKVIAENENIYNLIAEKILGFDFNGEYQHLIEKTQTVEELIESQNVIPFVFCLLNEIDNNEIELVSFIKQVYGDDSESSFGSFCETLIYEFVQRVFDALGETPSKEEEMDASSAIEELFSAGIDERVKYIIAVITEKLTGLKKVKNDLKRDIDITCFSIDLCLNLEQFAGILGLLSGLKYMLMPLKKFKAEIAEIDVILDSINNL